MKVHHMEPSGGMVVENPPDLRRFASSSARGGATVVLHGDLLIASTIPCTGHNETLGYAGLVEDYFDARSDAPEGKSLRMAANGEGITCELWAFEDDPDADPSVFPFEPEAMERLYRYILIHPRMRLLAAREDFDIEIMIYDIDQMPRWTYDASGLSCIADEEPSTTAGQAAMQPIR